MPTDFVIEMPCLSSVFVSVFLQGISYFHVKPGDFGSKLFKVKLNRCNLIPQL